MKKYLMNCLQSLLYSYVKCFDVESDYIACPAVDFFSGYAIIFTWNEHGTPFCHVVCFDPDELDEENEGLQFFNVDTVPNSLCGDYDSALKYMIMFCCEKLSSLIAWGFASELLMFDSLALLGGKVVFQSFVDNSK